MSKAIILSSIQLDRAILAPFTHRLTLTSGPWTHSANLELLNIEVKIVPSGGRQSTIGCQTDHGSFAEPFEHRLAHFAGAIETLCGWLQTHEPTAAHHLLQGVASAMVYFGRQYGLVTLDDEGTVTATTKREAQ